MNGATRQLLKSIEEASEYVFPGRKGKQRVEIHRAAKEIKDAAGLPKDFRALHGLRHVYASMLASSGQVDLLTLQRLLTHKDPKMTIRYAHLRDEALKRGADIAGEIIGNALSSRKRISTRVTSRSCKAFCHCGKQNNPQDSTWH